MLTIYVYEKLYQVFSNSIFNGRENLFGDNAELGMIMGY